MAPASKLQVPVVPGAWHKIRGIVTKHATSLESVRRGRGIYDLLGRRYSGSTELDFVPIKIISRRDVILYKFYPNSIQQFYARSNARETVEHYQVDSSTLARFRSDNASFG